jgi:hypothetical protein
MNRRLLVLLPLPLVAAFLFCACIQTKMCTLLACLSGVRVTSTFKQAGAYVFDVTVDGEKTTCRASLPLPPTAPTPTPPCDRSGVRLVLSGSALAPSEHSINGLELDTTTARSITIRATRDDRSIGESTVAPAYVLSPPPNGPDCGEGCLLATYSFP